MKSFLFTAIILGMAFSSCKKDDEEPTDPVVLPESSSRVLISNEGLFNTSTGSISVYDSETEELINGAFEAINGYSPGDIVQSMTAYDDKIYIVVNNSSKIEVVDKDSLISEDPAILGLSSPRYLLPINETKAYVSDLFSDKISIVNLQDKTITGQITIGADGSEEMLLFDGNAYVTSLASDHLYIINTNTDALVDSIQLTEGPVAIIQDSQDKLWVLCNGYFGLETPKLHRIDPSSGGVMTTYDIPAPYSYQMRLEVNGAGNRIYVMNNTVFSMEVNDMELNTTPVVPFPGNAYSLGISPMNGDIYVGDALNFSSPGKVYRYSSSGNLLDTMVVGISPGNFLFY